MDITEHFVNSDKATDQIKGVISNGGKVNRRLPGRERRRQSEAPIRPKRVCPRSCPLITLGNPEFNELYSVCGRDIMDLQHEMPDQCRTNAHDSRNCQRGAVTAPTSPGPAI